MNYRKESGELVTEESWLMRNLWDVTTPTGKGLAGSRFGILAYKNKIIY